MANPAAPAPDGAGERTALAAALDSLASCIATHPQDFSIYRLDAWLYGIVLGWDCDENHEHDDLCGGEAPMREVAARHGWDAAAVERLRVYHRAVLAALGAEITEALGGRP